MVVYAGAAGVWCWSPPRVTSRRKIIGALDRLTAGGFHERCGRYSRGLRNGPSRNFADEGINRILLATDGDFNVGTVDFDTLVDLVEREREAGVSLTTLGFGGGNYNDHLMERLGRRWQWQSCLYRQPERRT